jgi:hypothetical protein
MGCEKPASGNKQGKYCNRLVMLKQVAKKAAIDLCSHHAVQAEAHWGR